MDEACIIGYGVVGQATAKVFGIKKHFDIDPERSNITLEEAAKCKFVFICLPTNVQEDGSYNVDPLIEMITKINDLGNPIFIIRSTVYPGFAEITKQGIRSNRVVSNPEFLNEATAEHDAKNPSFILLGGDKEYVDKVAGFYQARIKGAPVITTDNTTAEMAKLTMNAYFATKVIFANQAYDACQMLGANYETVKKVLESHPYGPNNHFTIWFKGKRGVNGRCLPKDSKAFDYYTASDLIHEVLRLNEKYINIKEEDAVSA